MNDVGLETAGARRATTGGRLGAVYKAARCTRPMTASADTGKMDINEVPSTIRTRSIVIQMQKRGDGHRAVDQEVIRLVLAVLPDGLGDGTTLLEPGVDDLAQILIAAAFPEPRVHLVEQQGRLTTVDLPLCLDGVGGRGCGHLSDRLEWGTRCSVIVIALVLPQPNFGLMNSSRGL